MRHSVPSYLFGVHLRIDVAAPRSVILKPAHRINKQFTTLLVFLTLVSYVFRSLRVRTWNKCTLSTWFAWNIENFHQRLGAQHGKEVSARALTVALVISKHYRKFPASSWIFIRTINKASVAVACLRKICNIVARSFPAFLRWFLRTLTARHWRVDGDFWGK